MVLSVFGNDLDSLLLLAELYKTDKTISVADHQLKALEDLITKTDNLGIGISSLNALENLWEAKRPQVDEDEVEVVEIKKTTEDAITTNEKDSSTVKNNTEVDVSEFLGEIEKEETQGGLINEDKKKQSNLKWNIAIFILFLLAVIIWIFWVNRELIKEQQEQDEKDKNNDIGL